MADPETTTTLDEDPLARMLRRTAPASAGPPAAPAQPAEADPLVRMLTRTAPTVTAKTPSVLERWRHTRAPDLPSPVTAAQAIAQGVPAPWAQPWPTPWADPVAAAAEKVPGPLRGIYGKVAPTTMGEAAIYAALASQPEGWLAKVLLPTAAGGAGSLATGGDISKETQKGLIAGLVTPPLEYAGKSIAQWVGSGRQLSQATDWIAGKLKDALPGVWEAGTKARTVLADAVRRAPVLSTIRKNLDAAVGQLTGRARLTRETLQALGVDVPEGVASLRLPFQDAWARAVKLEKAGDYEAANLAKRALLDAYEGVNPLAAREARASLDQFGRATEISRILRRGKGKEEKAEDYLRKLTDPKTGELTYEGLAQITGQYAADPARAARAGLGEAAPYWTPEMGAMRARAGQGPIGHLRFGLPLPHATLRKPAVRFAPGWEAQVPYLQGLLGQAAPIISGVDLATLGAGLSPLP